MPGTTFVNNTTTIVASWLNGVDRAVVDAIGTGTTPPTTTAEVKVNLSLDNVDNTSDLDKPISTTQAVALAAVESNAAADATAKANAAAAASTPIAHNTNTANPHATTATQVGLGNVDNTSDATKNAASVVLTNKTIVVANNTITTAASGNLSATNLNAALAELQSDIDSTKAGIQAQTYTAFTTGGTSTAYTLTPIPAISSLVTGQEFDVTFHVAGGVSPTLSISGLTAKNLKYRDSTGTKVSIDATNIPINWESKVIYDGVDYVVRDVVVNTNAAVGGIGYRSGKYYSPFMVYPSNTVSATFMNGKTFLVPILIDKDVTLSAICCEVTTLVAAKVIRLGIYNNDNGIPSSLVLDAGTVSYATTGLKEISINQPLSKGWYWLALSSDATGTGALTASNSVYGTGDPTLLGSTSSDPSGTTIITHYTFVGITFPANVPALTERFGLTADMPFISVKVA